MLGPASHRIDASIIFIHELDTAWDRKRIDEETAAMADIAGAEHPVSVYLVGRTRYDLDAPLALWSRNEDGATATTVTVREYLTGEATIFALRRLKRAEWHDINREIQGTLSAILRSRPATIPEECYVLADTDVKRRVNAFEDAARLGLVSVDGVKWRGSEEDLERLHEMSSTLIRDIGSAVLAASAPLRRDEAFLSG